MFRLFLVEFIPGCRHVSGEFEWPQWVFVAVFLRGVRLPFFSTLVDLRTPHVMLELNDASTKPSTSFCCYLAGILWEDTFEETSGGSLGGRHLERRIWGQLSGITPGRLGITADHL